MIRKCVFLMVLWLMIPLHAADQKQDRVRSTKFQIEGGKLVLPGAISFEAGSDKLKDESEKSLWIIVDFLEAKKDITLLRIEGHTDNSAKPDISQELSEKRAMSVVRWLVSQGVDCKRLVAVGFGSNKPVAGNDTPQGRSENQRIEARMAGMRGRLIGGLPADGGGKVAGDPCEKK